MVNIYHGQDGKDGTNGKDGLNGKDGEDGKDGVDGEDGVVRFVVNVIAVKPRKGSLLEQKLHFYTLLVSPGAMEEISPL